MRHFFKKAEQAPGQIIKYQFPQPFWFLVGGSFINKAGNFVLPFFTLYLTSVQHLSISSATFVISLMGIGSVAAGICGGILADALGRRITIILSLLVAAGFALALGFADTICLILLLAIPYQFFTELFRPAASAVIADLVAPSHRGHAYSIRYWANNIGNAIGPLMAGLLAPISYLLLFIGDAVTSACFSLLLWFTLPETGPRNSRRRNEPQSARLQLRTAFTDPLLWTYSLLGLLFDCVYLQWATALPLDMQLHGMGTFEFGTVVATNAVVIVLISLPLTKFFQRVDLHVSLAVATLMMGTGMGLYSVLNGYIGYLSGAVFWTVGEILNYPIATALITELSPKSLRGSYQGIYSTIRAIATLLAPAVGGFLLEHTGSTIFWICCFGLSLFIACGYVFVGKVQKSLWWVHNSSAGNE